MKLLNSGVRGSFGVKNVRMAKHRDIWTGLELYLEDLLWGEKLNESTRTEGGRGVDTCNLGPGLKLF